MSAIDTGADARFAELVAAWVSACHPGGWAGTPTQLWDELFGWPGKKPWHRIPGVRSLSRRLTDIADRLLSSYGCAVEFERTRTERAILFIPAREWSQVR